MEVVVSQLWKLRHKGVVDKALASRIPSDLEQAYLYQFQSWINAKDSKEKRGSLAGWKVGATNEAGQKRFGLKEPFLGPLFKEYIKHGESFECNAKDMKIRGIEAEIAFFVGKDIPFSGKPYTAESIAEYISHVSPAVEICATRLDPPPSTGGPLIVDFAGNGAVLVSKSGKVPYTDKVLGLSSVVDVVVTKKGDKSVVAKGSSKEVLNHPLNSLTWLVNALNKLQRKHNPGARSVLESNSVVITGATCGLIPITEPANFNISFSSKSLNAVLDFTYSV